MPSCAAVESPPFQPAMRVVSAVTQSYPAQVTTTFAHDYNTGLIVSFRVPKGFGMTQLDKKVGIITIVDDTNFTVDIDTTGFDAFAVPGSYTQCPQVLPVGEIASKWDSATHRSTE